ncbi:MAG: tetratricopeptide repeat protein [Proteobacteria bacterium]|nr:tetratricopeptide repeat protein [Pseudomonadota bacterium]
MIILILFYMLNLGTYADDERSAKVDFYKGAKEFVNDINGIISNKEQIKKMESNAKFDDSVEGIEILEQSNRELSIKSFEDYIQKYPNSPYVPDAMYRLAKLYYEDTAQKVIKDTENYEKEYQKFLRGEIQVLPPDPAADYSDTIRLLNTLTKDYRDYQYRDDALYLLGYTYFEQGNPQKGIEAYEALIQEYPKNDKLAEVYTRLGEYYFDVDNVSRSVYYYSQVLEHPNSPYYENVIYKLAWTYYHKKRIDEASSFFVSLIDYNEKKFGTSYTSSTMNESKNYIAIGYADIPKGIQGAYDFFRKIGGRKYEYEIMQKICELYASSDRTKEALNAFNFVMEHYPYSPENPIIYEKVLNSIKPDQNLKLLGVERDRLIQLFGEGSTWREKNKDNIKAIFIVEQIIKKQLIAAAFYHQEKGDEKNDKKEYIKAAKLYYEFLKQYPMDGLVVGARFNYAKVLFNLGDYEGAIKEFTAVQDYTEDEKFKEESSFSLVTTWQNKLRRDQPRKYAIKDVKPLVDKDDKLLPQNALNEEEEATMAACAKYEKLNPKGKRLPHVWYIEAEIYFRNNMFDVSREKYENIVENYPNEKVATDSIRNMVASYTYEKNYPKIEEWSRKLLASKNFGVGLSSDEEEIKSLMTGSVFKSAKKMEEEGRYEDAANEYIRLAKQYPKSEYSDAALYNAGLIYEKVGDPINAIRSYRFMLVKYPRSRHTVEALFRVAVNYEQQLNFPNAIYFYEEITKRHSKTSFIADAHYNAARIRRAYNQYEKAANHFMAYSMMVKEQKEKANSLMLSASLYDKAGNYAKALNLYQYYIKQNRKDLDGVMLSHTSKARIYGQLNKKKLAYMEYVSAVNTFKASGSPSSDLQANEQNAESKFMIIFELSNKYHSIKVKNRSVKAMKIAYDQKQKLLQTLSEQYLKVINLGSPGWSVAALYMIGYEFQKFAEFLYEIPIPKQINTEQLINEYKSQIQTQAMPYEDKAIEYYEKSISESARLKIVNEWTKRAKQKLSKLKPEQYKESKEEIPVVYPSVDIRDYGFIGK